MTENADTSTPGEATCLGCGTVFWPFIITEFTQCPGCESREFTFHKRMTAAKNTPAGHIKDVQTFSSFPGYRPA